MNDLEVMKRAAAYIGDLANGVDPLSGNDLPESDIVNNVRISRCLFYVKGILDKVIENGGEVQREKLKKDELEDFSLSDEQKAALQLSDQALFLNKLLSAVNSSVDEYKMKKLKGQTVTKWLTEKGFLTEVVLSGGRVKKVPTTLGESIGIIEDEYFTPNGTFKNVAYTADAQRFIYDNIDEIAALASSEEREKAEKKRLETENAGKPWTEEDDEKLRRLVEEGSNIKLLCYEFRRTKGSIQARLDKLGLRLSDVPADTE